MLRKISSIMLCIIAIAVFCTACSKTGEPSDIKVSSGDTVIPHLMDAKDGFEECVEKNEELVYLKLGDKIRIEFQGDEPDTIELKNSLLYPDGNQKYTPKESDILDVELKNGVIEFDLPQDMTVLFSSDSKDYLPGNTIRGLKLKAVWGEEEREFYFVIRTDASFEETEE